MTPVVCLVHNDKPIERDTYRFLFSLASPEKQERIVRQRIKQNADNMLVGAVLAKYMVLKEFHIPFSEQRIKYGEYGKPYLSGYPNVHFNISHSGQYVVCAVYDRPVGIDIQVISPYRPDVARRVCSIEELEEIEHSEDTAAAFVKIWTQKEAQAKLTGQGICNDMIKALPLVKKQITFRYRDTMVTVAHS